MTVPVIGLGAGGHAKVIIEILRLQNEYEVVGLLDSNEKLFGKAILGVPVLGPDALLAEHARSGIRHFFVGVGSASDLRPRRRLFEFGCGLGLNPVSAIHPRSVVSPSATHGPGVQIMPCAVVHSCAVLGADIIVNTGAIVEHDCEVSDHVHVATGARLASAVRVGTMTHIGAGATVRQGASIGDNVVIGAGAVVVGDVPAGSVFVGVPARFLRPNEQSI